MKLSATLRFISLIALIPFILFASLVQAKQPNVLLIFTDDLNTNLGTYDHKVVKTPNIDALAKAGIQFNKAYAQATACAPSRASIMTGLYPHQNGVSDNAPHFRDIVPNVTTLPQAFKNNGYWTGRVGKVYHYDVPGHIGQNGHDDPKSWHQVSNPVGIDKALGKEANVIATTTPLGATLSWLKVDSKDEDHTDGKVTIHALSMLKQHQKTAPDQPFFFSVGYFRPHTPFIAPSKYFDMYPLEDIEPIVMPEGDRKDIPLAALADRKNQLSLTMQQRKQITQAYYASISFVDGQVGKLVKGLEQMGELDNTIIVFTSDHGFLLGEHNLWQKGDLFENSARVPLIMIPPKGTPVAKGKNDALVELIDLYPTITELAGVTAPDYIQGQSLVDLMQGKTSKIRDSAYTTMPSRAAKYYPELLYQKIDGHSIRTDRFRYTEWGNGVFGYELYDLQKDPNEINNLVHAYQYKTSLILLQKLLQQRQQKATENIVDWDNSSL